MRIIELVAENVKRLKAVSIRPPADLVVVSGKNGQGKSSVLDSIAYALAGKDVQPPKPVRDGQRRAKVVVDLDEIVVERVWTSDSKSYLKVTPRDGEAVGSPQQVLDQLVGSLSFDPLAFIRMAAREQVAVLKELTGLDFSEADAKRAALYEERTLVGREQKRAEGFLATMTRPDPGPTIPVSVTDLVQTHKRLLAQIEENREARRALQEQTTETENLATRIADMERALADLRQKHAASGEIAATLERQVAGLVDPDTREVEAQIENAEAINRVVAERVRYAEAAREVEAAKMKYGVLTDKIAELDQEKATRIADAKLPVEGLSFDEAGITMNGIPLSQASQAEQLKIALGLGLALNPRIRVVLIKDGSLLDDENLAVVGQMAAEHDAQVWVERVEEGEVGIVIEDGSVREVRE